MMLGLSLSTFTTAHVVLSLIGITTGLVALAGLLSGRQLKGWTALFLATTVLTSVTGFMFPSTALLPSHVVGGISLAVLAIALIALYLNKLAGAWRWVYVVAAVLALYLNVFVGVVQAFQKLAFLQPLAPTQSEAPFLIAQIAVLILFAGLGLIALRRFHPMTGAAA
ncbi:MAG: hypothetical protein K2X43_04735 [Hyphomonadaceae bacterium]|jgi:uncharacterized membrane protein SirB2|nr:hypothetical protein [Hyphomonadaceae bacterium]